MVYVFVVKPTVVETGFFDYAFAVVADSPFVEVSILYLTFLAVMVAVAHLLAKIRNLCKLVNKP